ncbi:MAG: ribonuclease HII [Lachnospiraceae bacterium]|nr:ribonuclease HII [Lachnospiraceae bacterium]
MLSGKLTLVQMENVLKNAGDKLEDYLKAFEQDVRPGAKRLVGKYRGMLEKLETERKRIFKMKEYERRYADYDYIAGIDEVGRGPLAGPVVTCAVILPKDCDILYINDSKQLTEKKREELYEQITAQAISYGIGVASPSRIDEINILQANYEAMREAIGKLSVIPDILLNDAVTIPDVRIPQVPIIKGDTKSISIAAASILAKVSRDRMMVEYDKVYPGYGFAANKGYGSEEHIKALKELGPSPIHRRSFLHNFGY